MSKSEIDITNPWRLGAGALSRAFAARRLSPVDVVDDLLTRIARLGPKHHTPGGSSSGSGVAVAARLAPWAIGTDTGGSVRLPASFCGITGLKVTIGRVSRYGIIPLSDTLDTPGPMARSVEDAALLFNVL